MSNTLPSPVGNNQNYANGYYGTGIANNYLFRARSFYTGDVVLNNAQSDTVTLDLATYTSAPATLFFYNYDAPERIEVYQGNTLIISTANAANLSSLEKSALVSNTYGSFFNDNPEFFMFDPVISTIANLQYAAFAGKLQWNHNPVNGTKYTIKVLKGNSSSEWRYLLEYPIDGYTIGCPPVRGSDPTGGGNTGPIQTPDPEPVGLVKGMFITTYSTYNLEGIIYGAESSAFVTDPAIIEAFRQNGGIATGGIAGAEGMPIQWQSGMGVGYQHTYGYYVDEEGYAYLTPEQVQQYANPQSRSYSPFNP